MILKKARDHRVHLFRYFLPLVAEKKAPVPWMKQGLPDGHDSQVIPEENWNLWVRYRS